MTADAYAPCLMVMWAWDRADPIRFCTAAKIEVFSDNTVMAKADIKLFLPVKALSLTCLYITGVGI